MTFGDITDRLSILERRIEVIEAERDEKLVDLPKNKDHGHNHLSDSEWQKLVNENQVVSATYAPQLSDLYLQRAYLIKEMGDILKKIFAEKRPAVFKRHKIYDQDTKIDNPTFFLKAISLLATQNSLQWDLEGARRETDDPKEVMRIQQLIGESNKKRNDYIDALDEIVAQSVKQIKLS